MRGPRARGRGGEYSATERQPPPHRRARTARSVHRALGRRGAAPPSRRHAPGVFGTPPTSSQPRGTTPLPPAPPCPPRARPGRAPGQRTRRGRSRGRRSIRLFARRLFAAFREQLVGEADVRGESRPACPQPLERCAPTLQHEPVWLCPRDEDVTRLDSQRSPQACRDDQPPLRPHPHLRVVARCHCTSSVAHLSKTGKLPRCGTLRRDGRKDRCTLAMESSSARLVAALPLVAPWRAKRSSGP